MTRLAREPSGLRRLRPAALAISACLFFFAASAHAAPAAHSAFARALAKGPVYAALATFVGGLVVSLTPCVYPMIAVTVSVFGAKEVKSRRQGVLLSAAFVLGIVTMFVPLGVGAAMTGGIFGSALNSPWVTIGLAALFLIMAASMFGAFELTLPSGITNRLATMGGIGYKGAFVLGLVCGPIAAPCTGPFLTGILAWIAKTQSVVLGAGAMAAFALGLGLPFFLVGAFAVQLPKSGRWMMHIKSLLGLVLVVVALYMLNNSFPAMSRFANPSVKFLAIAGVVALVGLVLGAVHRSFDEPGVGVKVAKGTGIVLTSVGSFLLIVGAIKPARTLSWEKVSVAQARAQALREDRPLLVDFGATWCGACKELDKKTFSDAAVKRAAGRFVAVHVDATNDDDPNVVATERQFHVRGLPTVVVFDSSGKEALRYTDFVKPNVFLAAIKKVN